MTRRTYTRRGVAATLAATALAGCSGGDDLRLPWQERRLDAADIRVDDPATDDDGDPRPPVVETYPVTVAPAQFRGHRDRTLALLGRLPTPVPAETVPNGAVRAAVADGAVDAGEALGDAQTARSERIALDRLRYARRRAAYAAAGWRFADGSLTLAAVRERLAAVRTDARDAAAEHTYVASDPVTAVACHAAVEWGFEAATDPDEPHTESELLRVAEHAAAAEAARARLSDVRHLAARAAAGGDTDYHDRIRSVARELFDRVRRERESVPPAPTGDDRRLARRALDELDYAARREQVGLDESPGPASAVVDATRSLSALSALSWLHTQVDQGDLDRVDSAEWAVEVRNDAAAVLTTAVETTEVPALARPILVDAGHRLADADAGLEQLDDYGEIDPRRLHRPVAASVAASGLAAAALEVCPRVAARLRDTGET
ncbi:hypothetical protein [Halobaculum sp. MBLA0143]|uniref:hypothetical protein n=1 Tax=Halobaculum sp. MBLA0143 TaxID=3079933 RepID=UPI003524EF77